jgi:hypothetical protein
MNIICKYCGKNGHLLKECKNGSIFLMDDRLKYIAIADYFFSDYSFLINEINSYSIEKLKVLGYLYSLKLGNIKQNIIQKYKRLTESFIISLLQKLSNETFYDFIEDFLIFFISFKQRNILSVLDRTILLQIVLNRLCKLSNILNLNISLDNKYFISYRKSNEKWSNIDKTCPICYIELNPSNLIITKCDHYYCFSCFDQYIISMKNSELPLTCCCCRSKISSLSYYSDKEFNIIKKKYFLPNIIF